MSTVQAIALLAGIVFLAQTLLLTSRRRLRDRHAFVWLLLSVLGVLVAAALPAFDWVADSLGIAYAPTLVFMAIFYLVLSLLVYHTTVLSHQQDGLKALAQEVAYLRRDLQDVLARLDGPPQSGADLPGHGSELPLAGADLPGRDSELPLTGADLPGASSELRAAGADLQSAAAEPAPAGADFPAPKERQSP